MASLPQDTFADDYVVTAPIHSRLPRLDLGIDWMPRWEEFRTSLRGALTGPKPNGSEAVSGGEDLRVEWIRGYRPRSPFLVAALGHALAIWLITLPIWGFLPQTQAAVPMQLNVQWDLSELPAISLPARTVKKPIARSRSNDAAKTSQQQRGADAFNPRQTILSTPVRLTHPRQTLIEPDAPMKAPTIVQQLPNIVQWSAPQLQRPTIEYSTSQSKPELRQMRHHSAAAPEIAENAKAETLDIAGTSEIHVAVPAPVVSKAVIAPRRAMPRAAVAAPHLGDNPENASLLNVAETSEVQLAPPAPLPSNSAVMARHRVSRQAAAPEIAEQANGNPDDVRKLIAISAAPAPPAPEVQIPKGNLAANVAISPDGKKPGSPAGVEHGGTDSAAAGSKGDSLPAAISVSGLSGKAANGAGSARPGNITPHLNLSTRPMIYPGSSAPHAARTGPANVAALPPGAPPEQLLSGKVFSMHVSTPNTTSTLGSWTLSFAQLGDSGVAAGPNTELSGPEPVYTVDPKYPPDTMLEHIEGEVVLYAIIRKDGSVDSIQLVQSLDARLDRAAMDALAQWKFRPGSRAGKPVDLEAVIHVPFEYRHVRY